MKKNLLALISLYTFQFLLSACDCNCPPVNTYNSVYTDFILESWDTSGFNSSEIATRAFKNAFGLSINLNISEERVTTSKSTVSFASFGFSTAYAFSDCICDDDNYLISDPIVDIDIYVTNTITNKRINITQNFKSSSYYGVNGISVKELFQDLERWDDNFRFDLIKFDNIPDNAVFTSTILLDSGKELTQSTNEITFLKI